MVDRRQLLGEGHARVALLICACFLLTSTGWLAWLYHLTSLVSPTSVDVLTMGVGYLMQAAGIGAFVFTMRAQRTYRIQHACSAATLLYAACLVPAVLSPEAAASLAFGYLDSLLCGFLQAYYLSFLARYVDSAHRGIVFGGAYAISTLISWLLAAVAGGALTRGVPGLLTCCCMTALTIAVIRLQVPTAESEDMETSEDKVPAFSEQDSLLLPLSLLVVILMSLTKGMGYGFPSTDLIAGVNLELSRLLYGIGLLLAGVVSDRNRRYGAIFCAGGLVTPFLMLALSGAAAPATVMWALGYLLFGFFALYRVILLADLAARAKRYLGAGFGLLAGRVGDALGTILLAVLGGMPLVLITVTSVLFACTMALFFLLYQRMFMVAPPSKPSEREVFERFSARHDLSAREREVLRLVLKERTNAEIAAELFVSEATVKFHVRNLLRKTGCHNRLEILSAYAAQD